MSHFAHFWPFDPSFQSESEMNDRTPKKGPKTPDETGLFFNQTPLRTIKLAWANIKEQVCVFAQKCTFKLARSITGWLCQPVLYRFA